MAATKDGTKRPDIPAEKNQQKSAPATTGQEIPGTKYDNYRVVVPADKKGGDILDVTLKNGKVIQVKLPDAAAPGTAMIIKIATKPPKQSHPLLKYGIMPWAFAILIVALLATLALRWANEFVNATANPEHPGVPYRPIHTPTAHTEPRSEQRRNRRNRRNRRTEKSNQNKRRSDHGGGVSQSSASGLCLHWQATSGCSPDGTLEETLPCSKQISGGSSGYCQCEGGKRIQEVSCGHRAFTCEEECKKTRMKSSCRWHETRDCKPYGKRTYRQDKRCDQWVPSHIAGFCQCPGWRTTARSDCSHLPTRCDFECAALLDDDKRAADRQLIDWLRGSVWHWNDWEDVKLLPDQTFEASNCLDTDKCLWNVVDQWLVIQWASNGLHLAKVDTGRKRLEGKRVRDGDSVSAMLRSRDNVVDFYSVLGLSDAATGRDIKRAFRKLSKQYHPDKDKSDEAAVKFRQIREANEVLADADKRALYDSGGKEVVDKYYGRDTKDPPQEEPINLDIEITLEQMYTGVELQTYITRRVVCRGCRFARDGKCRGCTRCPDQSETYFESVGHFQMEKQRMVQSKEKCKKEEKRFVFQIEKGMDKWTKIPLLRGGTQSPGHIPGDIILKVKELPHKQFVRRGDDLYMDVEIGLKDALLGLNKEITHLDGHTVRIALDDSVQPGDSIKVEGEGMPVKDIPSQHGDLYIHIKITLPQSLTSNQKRSIRDNF